MTIVIKLGGRVQSDPRLAAAISTLWKSAPGSVCIVHGGGDEVSALQRELGREPAFIGGRRVTSLEDVDLVRMVLSGRANKRLVSLLSAAGAPAVGISGEDGRLLPAEVIDAGRFGRAGRPVGAETGIIGTLLNAGWLPVISPVGTEAASSHNEALNINGDDAAAAIAGALGAELWMIADVAGVLGSEGDLITELDQRETDELVSSGVVTSGMQAKLEAGFNALRSGAAAVRITSLEAFDDDKAGTFLSLTPS